MAIKVLLYFRGWRQGEKAWSVNLFNSCKGNQKHMSMILLYCLVYADCIWII